MTNEELVQLKQDLDKASDLLTLKIEGFEADLKKLSLGVHCWVKISDTTQFGYTKFDGEWMLVVKYKEFENDMISPLLMANRGLRVVCYKNRQKLIDSLESSASKLLKQINKILVGDNSEESESEVSGGYVSE